MAAGFPLSFGCSVSSQCWCSVVFSCSYGGFVTSSGSTSVEEALGQLVAAQQQWANRGYGSKLADANSNKIGRYI
jgi:hypothetical protein